MSRIAKDTVIVPASVNITIEGNSINFKGPKGERTLEVHESVSFTQEENSIQVKWQKDEERAMAGTMRALISNYVKGVAEGFEKNIKLNGVGYRAKVQGKKITFTLGFSHPVDYELPQTVEAKQENQTEITLSSCNKQLLGQVCAEIRAFRPPEPYKGKGIFVDNEHIIIKEIKKAAAAG